MRVYKKYNLVLEDTHKGVDEMWNVHLFTTTHPSPTPTGKSANNLMKDNTKPELSQWCHTTLFSPVKKNLIQEIINGYFATSPKSTIDLINKHIPPSMATDKGHMHQKGKNPQSTISKDPKIQ